MYSGCCRHKAIAPASAVDRVFLTVSYPFSVKDMLFMHSVPIEAMSAAFNSSTTAVTRTSFLVERVGMHSGHVDERRGWGRLFLCNIPEIKGVTPVVTLQIDGHKK